MYGLVEATRARLGEAAPVFGYGHVGDGNLHLNVTTPEFCEKTAALLEPFVYEWTAEHRGSVSAEHGVGLMKVDALRYTKSEAAVSAMRAIKQTLDPRGILNPYKVLPPPPGGP
jgi:D-2-hydroxyglutarate dehydrogenase